MNAANLTDDQRLELADNVQPHLIRMTQARAFMAELAAKKKEASDAHKAAVEAYMTLAAELEDIYRDVTEPRLDFPQQAESA